MMTTSFLKTLSLVVPMGLVALATSAAFAQSNPSADAQAWLAGQVIVSEPGNNGEPQPPLDDLTIKRMQKRQSAFTEDRQRAVITSKYKAALRLFANDPALVAQIRAAGRAYGIDPIMIVGSIIGEHTFNVDIYDTAQEYTVRTASLVGGWALKFSSVGFALSDVVQLPEMKRCHQQSSDYSFWICAQNVWDVKFRGQSAYGYTFPDSSLRLAFFNPILSGYTYGLGQLDPLRALMVSDRVHQTSGLPELQVDDPVAIYSAIIAPETTILYMAANLRVILDTYRDTAHFDISNNPGLVASLYNLGKEDVRAAALNAADKKLAPKGELRYPRVNYYGWYINEHESEIRAIVEGTN